MIEKLGQLLSVLPRELYVFLISMLPIIELRGAVPVGAALGLPFYVNYCLSVVGNLLPVPFILLFIPMILNFLGRFGIFKPMVKWIHAKAQKYKGHIIKDDVKHKSESVIVNSDMTGKIDSFADECSNVGEGGSSRDVRERLSVGVFVALMLFVAIPFPGTGAWTGSLVAALFGLPKRDSFVAIALGVFISGVIMTLASYGIVGFLGFLI